MFNHTAVDCLTTSSDTVHTFVNVYCGPERNGRNEEVIVAYSKTIPIFACKFRRTQQEHGRREDLK